MFTHVCGFSNTSFARACSSGNRSLTPPPEWIEYRQEQKLERERNKKLRGGKEEEGKEEDKDPIVAFRLKRFKFFRNLKKYNKADSSKVNLYPLEITRSNLFADTLNIFSKISRGELTRRFKIVFEGEPGIDSGGITKDWYLMLSRSLSVEKHKVFKSVKSAGGHLEINQEASPNPLQVRVIRREKSVLARERARDAPRNMCGSARAALT